MRKMQADVIVVAAGPAGLAAAITAGEYGRKALVFEKTTVTGGAANMGMGPLGIDTRVQKSCFNDITAEYALAKHMEYTHYCADAGLVSAYFHKSAETISWLEEMGVKFAGAFRYSRDSEATWHIVQPEDGQIGPRCASAMVKCMTKRALELGAQICYSTPVDDLIVEDGTVVGVYAHDETGEKIEARGQAVVVCTGGFGSNAEMVREECGLELGKDIISFMIPGIMGDGLKMMWKAGAQKFGANFERIYLCKDQLNHMTLDIMFRQGDLMVNLDGERFMNEDDAGNTTFGGNAIAMQPRRVAVSIIDGDIARRHQRDGLPHVSLVEPEFLVQAFDAAVQDALDNGYEDFYKADTVEELAEQIGIPAETLRSTIEAYNACCASGVDKEFGKASKYLNPVTGKGGYMALKYYTGAYGTVGGVRVNKRCEVLDQDSKPIPGLYSAGSDANTIYADSYNFKLPGNTMGFAINSGRMAGEAMCAYLDELGVGEIDYDEYE